MKTRLGPSDRVGLVKPALDVHTLGMVAVEQLLRECGVSCVTADAAISKVLDRPADPGSMHIIDAWIRENRISVLGFSFRLDAATGARLFGQMARILDIRRLLETHGGPLRTVYVAGLPETCERVSRENPWIAGTFSGDETPAEVLEKFGVPAGRMPRALGEGLAYDEARLSFGKDLIGKEQHRAVKPAPRPDYPGFGAEKDTLVARLAHAAQNGLLPLVRAHAGPYLPDRKEAVALFLDWCRQLGAGGFLDILSIGTSQLTQSNFGENWEGLPNAGGVPVNSPEEFLSIWKASRPMLVRTYAGTKNVGALARMYEETIHIAWHALSLWWFCRIDGRGPYSVRENLQAHIQALRYIAATGKPFEPNVPHHFAFRGADDVTYVVSAVLAARTAKAAGIRHLLLQNMLSTPRATWGIQDLAKSRAMLRLVRALEDGNFSVILQPRAGLAHFSSDSERAKAQLAAATALMDDIEPANPASPPVIHVVSYSEGRSLADPAIIEESIQITRAALQEYRALRARGAVADMGNHEDVQNRTEQLVQDARAVLQAIEAEVPTPESAEGLYRVMALGFLPVPHLSECRDEFLNAVSWETRMVQGGVCVVDEHGKPTPVEDRLRLVREINGGRVT